MRGLVLVVMLAACGRLGFDARTDGGDAGVEPDARVCVTIPLTNLHNDLGFEFVLFGAIDEFGPNADTGPENERSALQLFEDGIELGPAHASHADIRTIGLGLFSHWRATNGSGDSIRWSTSDNTDARTNGRVYSYCN